jgi:hypothetical protein
VLGNPTPDGVAVNVNVGTDLLTQSLGLGSLGLGNVGLNAEVNLNGLVGFDVQLGVDGVFVGADIELGRMLHLDHLASSLVEIVASDTALDLGHLLTSDVPGLDLLLGSGEHLSNIKATVAEVSGLLLASDPEALLNELGGVTVGTVAATLVEPAGTLLTQPLDTLLSGDAVPIHVLSDLTDLGPTGQSGDLSSGGAITFPAQAVNDVVQPDVLFAGGQYSDYNLALQSSIKSNAETAAVIPDNDLVDSTVPSLSPSDVPTDRHDSGNLPLGTTLVDLSASVEDVSGRVL